MKETFKISDLFITDWLTPDKKQTLSAKDMLQVIHFRDQMTKATQQGMHGAAGHCAIMLLRLLRKDNGNVAKINLDQAVDCVNDLTFVHKPWLFFPIPEFTAGGKTFTPPGEKMEDRCFEQLVYADSKFSMYCITDYNDRHAIPSMDPSAMAESYIDDMIAILYQLPETFNDKNIDDDSRAIAKKLTATDKACFLHTYANIREYIETTHPHLLPKGDIYENTEEHAPVYIGQQWINLLFELAESPVFPGLEKASKAELYKALYWLNKKSGEVKPIPNAEG